MSEIHSRATTPEYSDGWDRIFDSKKTDDGIKDEMTSQEIFDHVVNHLRKQNCKATDPNRGHCAYRGHDGWKCAVGCLIRDDEYNDKMEGAVIRSIMPRDTGENPRNVLPSMVKRLKPHLKLLNQLQDTHDNFPITRWENKFNDISIAFSLTLPLEENPKHNHFGEIFSPTTCPACQVQDTRLE